MSGRCGISDLEGGFLLHFEGFCCCILRVFVLEEASCKVGSGA